MYKKLLAKAHIFQKGLRWKSSQMMKEPCPNKEGLVSVNDSGMMASKVIEPRNHSESPILARKLMLESSCLTALIT